MPEGSTRKKRREHQPGWGGLRADLAKGISHLFRRTSTRHKRFVLAAFAVGTVLRILRLNQPVTYDEAVTFTEYAGRSFGFLLSDYSFAGNHILYSALARLALLVFGPHTWSLRLPALIAGVLVMPLGYAFVRTVFNRHIAVIFLCLVAAGGSLVEYSAMARGYSLVWLCTCLALIAGHYFVKSENMWAATGMAASCALGMWAAPAMAYPALMVFAWVLFMLLARYQSTIRRRVLKLAGAFVMALALTFLCYLPVIMVHSLDLLLHHPSMVDNTWAAFSTTQQDRVFDIWAYFTATSSTVMLLVGAALVLFAASASAKYRYLLIALVLGAFPLALVLHVVAPPAAWTYALLVFHMGGAIGLFYLLKAVRDKLAPSFSKGQRTLVAALFVLLLFGWAGLHGKGDAVERFPEAQQAAAWIAENTRPEDRVGVQPPWDAPVRFYLACAKGDALRLGGPPVPGGRMFLLVVPAHGQSPKSVFRDAELGNRVPDGLQEMGRWGRIELFSAQ